MFRMETKWGTLTPDFLEPSVIMLGASLHQKDRGREGAIPFSRDLRVKTEIGLPRRRFLAVTAHSLCPVKTPVNTWEEDCDTLTKFHTAQAGEARSRARWQDCVPKSPNGGELRPLRMGLEPAGRF